MVRVIFTHRFKKEFNKKDVFIRKKINKQIKKIIENPNVGKPLRLTLTGERAVYIKPFRLIYTFTSDKIIILRFDHRKKVYG